MKRIAIIGSSYLAQQITHFIDQLSECKVVGYFDDFQIKGTFINNIEILGRVDDIILSFNESFFDELIIAIGYKHMSVRAKLYDKFKSNIPFYTFVHSSCIVDPTCKIGEGTIVYPGCLVDQNVIIGDNVLLNISAVIAHDVVIKNHCFIAPRVAIAGFVTVEEQCVLGINSTIIDNIKISPKVQLGGGAVVIKDIKKQGLYVGNPIRFVR